MEMEKRGLLVSGGGGLLFLPAIFSGVLSMYRTGGKTPFFSGRGGVDFP